MSMSTFQRIVAVLAQAKEPLKASEIAKASRLKLRKVALTIHHENNGEILIIRQGDERRYQLREATA